MSGSGPDVAAWAAAHRARFEVEPLIEMRLGQRMHVGYTVRLSARLPRKEGPLAQRQAAAEEIGTRLRELLQSLAPPASARARLEIDPRLQAVIAPRGAGPTEIAVSARVFHGEDYFAEVTEDEEKKVYAGARRLAEMGLRERRRRLP